MNSVRAERTGWRDQEISAKHRDWGFNCPAVDLDFLMLEYNHSKPSALVEYKHKNAIPPNTRAANYRALVALADMGNIPCLIATYDPNDWSFIVTPLNEKARIYYGRAAGIVLSEKRFVKSLYLLRKTTLSKEDDLVIGKLSGEETPINNQKEPAK